ncbi:MAG: UvrD-helicase domain-containing protein [Anaerostipes sp.]|nr:UvrD-helicase domain-containing protein [Anaerostipes sp.]
MQPIDQETRIKIMSQGGNIIISASAGTGKTHTTILKIKDDMETNKSFSTFGAITFTKKAAKEIESKLQGDKREAFVGTNDNFVLQEIIRPFMYDVYGREFKKEIKPDYSTANQIQDYDMGIKAIRDTGFLCKYADNKKNYSFQLALKILMESEAARMYLISKYYRIYIDEYQDCDKDMHNLFKYIYKDLSIPMFIVGDLKQSIYGWRGGYDKGFKDLLTDRDFTPFELKHNFRSVICIQNYANMFIDDVRENFRKVPFDNSVHCFAYKQPFFAIKKIEEWIDEDEKCAFLIRNRLDGKKWAQWLQDNNVEFTYISSSPLDNSDMESEHIWIARQIAYYILNDVYSEYDFYDEIPNADSYNFSNIRRMLFSIEKTADDMEMFNNNCSTLYEILGYELSERTAKEIEVLFQVINDDEYIPTYNSEKYKHVITTIHSAKGLQYKQVIVLAENYNLNILEDCNLHYVAVSRPEEKLLVLCNYRNSNGKAYCNAIKSNIQRIKKLGFDIEMRDVAVCFNSEEFKKD